MDILFKRIYNDRVTRCLSTECFDRTATAYDRTKATFAWISASMQVEAVRSLEMLAIISTQANLRLCSIPMMT